MSEESYNYFMKLNLKPYSDEWIAIVNDRVVSHGRNAKDVFRQAKKEYPKSNPLITKVPGKMTMIL